MILKITNIITQQKEMKKNILILSLITLSSTAFAQIGMNTTTPQSTLDITAKSSAGLSPEGLLIPRVGRLKAQDMTDVATSTLIYVNNISIPLH